jgi:hypothetical protein
LKPTNTLHDRKVKLLNAKVGYVSRPISLLNGFSSAFPIA